MKKWILLVVVVVFGFQGTALKASEIDELKEQLAQQAKLLNQMQQRLEKMESSQQDQEKMVDKKITEAVESKQFASLPDSAKWIEKIKWGGDFRYRHEMIDDDTATTQRDRDRIRARLKIQAMINNEWDAYFRIASGSSDSPTSTNQTLGDSGSDSFSSKDIWLDWAYANYHPESIDGLNVKIGKMETPFYRVAKHQLIYDGDLSPEGGAVSYGWNLNDSTTANLTGGAFWLRERGSDVDTSLFGAQGYLKHKLDSDSHILGGLSYYDFGNIKGQTLAGIGSKGNTVAGDGSYLNDYDLLEAFGEYGFKLGATPASVFGSYVNNTGATSSEDTAWIVGAKYNKAKKPGTWEASYNYRDVEADAVVGGLCDSDFIGGGTDGKGHVLGFKYQLAENTQAALHYFINEKNASTTGDNFNLLQADLIFKF
ncbi:MAG: putative porin [Phycisphaerae bacterium]|nr:putative porin [Phycisphaerae bacterium]